MKSRDRHTERRWPCSGGGRDWGDVAAIPATGPLDTLDVGLPVSRIVGESISVALSHPN